MTFTIFYIYNSTQQLSLCYKIIGFYHKKTINQLITNLVCIYISKIDRHIPFKILVRYSYEFDI